MYIIGKAKLNSKRYIEYVSKENRLSAERKPGWYTKLSDIYPKEITDVAWKCMKRTGWSEEYNCVLSVPDELVTENIKMHQEYINSMGISWELMFYDTYVAIIRSGELMVAVPSDVIAPELYRNVDDIPVVELYNQIGNDGKETAIADHFPVTKNQMKKKIARKCDEINEQQAKLKKLEEEKKAELEQFRLELEKKYEEKMSFLNKKQEEMKQQMETLKQQMFLLDTEIYSIRCLMGETVDFVQLTTGSHSNEKEPMVIYQKLRFLDEELGKWVSLYHVDGDDQCLFEELLKQREDLRSMFLPSKKCISLVQIARNRVHYCDNNIVANALEKCEVFHARTIGILVRDGDNVWIGWTDQDRINIPDENAFYRPSERSDAVLDERQKYTSSTKEDIASRYFIFSILQGIINNGKMIRLPENIQISKKTPYIIFSMADGWLEDNRYGTFSDIVERTDQPLMKGDMILTTLRITRDDAYFKDKYAAWNNDRGRGEKNRTHDASIKNCVVVPINCIDKEKVYSHVYRKYRLKVRDEVIDAENGGKVRTIKHITERTSEYLGLDHQMVEIVNDMLLNHSTKKMTPEQIYALCKELYYYTKDEMEYVTTSANNSDKYAGSYYTVYDHTELLEEIQHSYVSAKKSDSNYWGEGRDSYANMEIYPNEYLNLTFLNSIYLTYAIQNGKMGGWKRGNVMVSYADSIPYLNKALEYIRKREKQEAEMLKMYMELYEGWQVDLSEWRLQNNYHRLTTARAKKFAKFIYAKNKI